MAEVEIAKRRAESVN